MSKKPAQGGKLTMKKRKLRKLAVNEVSHVRGGGEEPPVDGGGGEFGPTYRCLTITNHNQALRRR